MSEDLNAPVDDAAHPIIRLRDLQGVAEVESLLAAARQLRGPNWQWCAEYEEAQAQAERVSRRLFGIIEAETRYVDDPELTKADNDELFGGWEWSFRSFSFNGHPTEDADWASLDWDVDDADGQPLLSLLFFHRQIVAVEYSLAGHLPGDSEELSATETASIEARLRAEAAKFRSKSK